MAYLKTIVCLANSFKTDGRCVAGREVRANGYGDWIRPVSARETAEVSLSDCRYKDDQIPRLLDILHVPLLRPEPNLHQTENHLIDTTQRWARAGRLRWEALPRLCDYPAALWINSDSTSTGSFNCISQAEAATQRNSLALIRPEQFAVEVGSRTWDGRTKRTYRGSFVYHGIRYRLSLTDPVAYDAFRLREAGAYRSTMFTFASA